MMATPTEALPASRPAAFFQRLVATPLFRQISQMVLSRGIGLAVAAAGSIWAARCLGPYKLGITAMILSFVAPLTLLVDLNQDVALVRRFKDCPDNAARRRLMQQTFAFRLLLALGWMLLAALGIAVIGLPGLDWRLGVVAAFPLLLVTVNQAAWVLQAQENMPGRYRALLVQSLVGASCYFLLFRPGKMPAGSDIFVMALAVTCEFAVGWWLAYRPLLGESARRPLAFARRWRIIRRDLRNASRAYWLGRWLAITGIVSYLYIYLQTPLVGFLIGTEAVGQYRTAGTLLNGFQAFAMMIPALLYPRMIEWHRRGDDELWRQQWRFLRLALVFFIPGAALAVAFAPYLYALLYGPAFAAAAIPFAVLLISRMLMVLNGIFGWGLWAQGRDRLFLLLSLGTAIISLGLNFALIPRFGILGAAGVCVVSEALMLVITMIATRAIRDRSARGSASSS